MYSLYPAEQQNLHKPAQNQGTVPKRPGVITYLISSHKFDIPNRYTPIKLIGQGAYGAVCSAKDNLTGENAAIKKIPNAFVNLTDTKRVLREIKLLKHLKHENIIAIKDIFKPVSKVEYDDIYLVSELMDTDLQQIISSNQPLSDDHCQYFLYQILRALKYLHSANVLHRDLKPSNILCNRDCLIKIADFGLARVEEQVSGYMTEYVATRWYRAPEVILNWKEYTKAIDIWSVGCIFAELLLRRPLFQGKDYIHQVARITDIIGTPSEEDTYHLATEQGRRYIKSLGYKAKIPFTKIFPNHNPAAIDLLERMLVFDPGKRISVEDALAHPYLASLHDINDEPIANVIFDFDFDFERNPHSKDSYQELVWKEMLSFHPEALEEEMARQAELQAASFMQYQPGQQMPLPASMMFPDII